jgi:hypothetical protein
MDVAQVLPFAKPIAATTGKAFNYVKNLEPAAPGPMMLMGRFADDVAKTGDDVAKVVSKAETPKSNFKSEIDWDKWNPEISKNPELLQEYNAIEEAAKADGTWMKNPDGSPFVLPDGKAGQHWTFTKGTPEQFVQMQSQNFKKAYPEGFDAWYTGRMKDPTEQFPLFAELYPEGRSIFGGDYHVATRYASTQPEGYDTFKRLTTEFKPKEITKFTDADQTAKAHGLISPKTSNSFLFNARKQGWREIPVGSDTGITPMWEGQPIENFRESLKTTFKNPRTGIDEKGYKVKSDDIAEHLEKNNMDYATIEDVVDGSVADYVRIHNLKSGNYPKSLWGNNGMFDLSNPNIYKAIIPTVGVAGTATMLANPFQDSDGLQQQQYGGALSKFIGGGSPCDDGYTYDPKLGCIPLSEENMTEDQKWMVDWYKNRKIQFPEDQPSFKKVVEKTLPAYNPESPMLEQMQSFPVYETMPKEYMQEDIGGFPAAGMYDTSGKVPKIYFNPELTPEQKSDTERHELTNYLMEPVKDKLYPMYNKIVEENIIPFDENWPKEKQDFYDYVIDPEEQNIQSYLNVARKKFNLKADEVITPERLNEMRKQAEEKGMFDQKSKSFNPDIYLLFKMAKDDEGLMKLFNLIAKNENSQDIQYGKYGTQVNNLSKFVDGGEKCPPFHKYHEATQSCLPMTEKEKAAYSLQYMKDWVQSPMHEQMLRASIEKDAPVGNIDNYVKNITDLRLKATNPKISIKDRDSEDLPYGEAAPYVYDDSIYFDDPNNIKIINPLNPEKTADKDLQGVVNYYTKNLPGEHGYVYPHEISHLQDMGGNLIPPSDKTLIENYAFTPEIEEVYQNMRKEKKLILDKYKDSSPELDKELSDVYKKYYPKYGNRYNLDKDLYEKDFNKFKLQKYLGEGLDNSLPYQEFVEKNLNEFDDPAVRHGYFANDSESRARLNAIRMYGKEFGIYDPLTEELTPEKYNQIKELFNKQNPNTKDANQLRQLQEVYKDEDILNMLNTISMNSSEPVDEDLPQMAKYGGSNYQLGDEIDEATMNELKRLGYTFEEL